MLKRIREHLVLTLIAVLPFHALLVTVGTKLLRGTGHAPLAELAIWKEALLGLILLVVAAEILRNFKWKWWRLDVIDWLIVGLVAVAIAVSGFKFQVSSFQVLLGFKYSLLPLIAFIVLRRVPWSDWFMQYVLKVLLAVGAIVAAYGLASFFLPQSFFTALGYSDLHSLYQPDAPLAAFQQISGSSIRRIQGTMSGPNQLGLWLLMPLSVLVVMIVRRDVYSFIRLFVYSSLVLVVVALFLTFSRSAWLAAAVIIVVAIAISFPRSRAKRLLLGLAGMGVVLILVIAILAPGILSRVTSTRGHIEKPIQAVRTIAANPLGLGLGSAGPASNRVSDPCVFLEEDADASWAETHPNLCVFVGGAQVQPLNTTCNCPLITENWYLQIGVELGVLGFVLFLALTLMLLKQLILNSQFSILNSSAALAFLGLSIAALFLHAWEGSAVAYTVWLLLGILLSSNDTRVDRSLL